MYGISIVGENTVRKGAFASKKARDRSEGDFYPTPKSLVWAVQDTIFREFSRSKPILEPCCGEGAISNELKLYGYTVQENDLFHGGVDYLKKPFNVPHMITNPPFSLWDEFVEKAKQECKKIMLIGRLNFFGTASRLRNGMWSHLKEVHIFNRYVDYRTPMREDGFFHIGAMATAWFLWDTAFDGAPAMYFVDVQEYARLGNK